MTLGLRITLTVAVIMALAFTFSESIGPNRAVAVTAPPIPSFTIAGPLPLPVTGSTTVSGSVSISGTPSVTISGTPTVNVTGEQAYQQTFRFNGTFLGRCANNQEQLAVPTGKILVIDNVFVAAEAPSLENRPIAVFQSAYGGQVSHPRFAPPVEGVFSDGTNTFSGTFPTKVLVQPTAGSVNPGVLIDGCTLGPETAGNFFVEAVVTGHLVPAP